MALPASASSKSMGSRLCVILLCVLVAACKPAPEPVSPAFWEVQGPQGQKAWLFGTVHALDAPVDWKSPVVGQALAESDLILVEVAGLDDPQTMANTFASLARRTDPAPLAGRIDADLRDELTEVLAKHGLKARQFMTIDTWAVALTIARAETADLDAKYGIDRAVLDAANGKEVAEFEGTAGQLAIFDGLPETDQRDLLEAIVTEAAEGKSDETQLIDAWRDGDLALMEKATEQGFLADPELREALLTGRNRAWADRIVLELEGSRRPFIAVGAGHMAGKAGLPALLESRGLKVRRVQ